MNLSIKQVFPQESLLIGYLQLFDNSFLPVTKLDEAEKQLEAVGFSADVQSPAEFNLGFSCRLNKDILICVIRTDEDKAGTYELLPSEQRLVKKVWHNMCHNAVFWRSSHGTIKLKANIKSPHDGRTMSEKIDQIGSCINTFLLFCGYSHNAVDIHPATCGGYHLVINY